MTLVDAPQEASGPFRHNLFHGATSAGGAGGSILSWFALDTAFGASNFYDPATGDLEAHFDLFATSSLTSPIGTAQVLSSTVDGSVLGDAVESGVLVGTLSWEIDLSSTGSGPLHDHLVASFGDEADDIWNLDTDFADVFYVTSSGGRTANRWADPHLTLWAAGAPNGLSFTGSSKTGGSGGLGGFGSTAALGVDLVLTVPEPDSAPLLALGLGGLWLAGRRRRAPASA